MSLELLRQQIKKLNIERDIVIMEKGLAAEANKDLRENSNFDYWLEKEIILTGKIAHLISEIERLAGKTTVKKTLKTVKNTKVTKIKDLPKTRWL